MNDVSKTAPPATHPAVQEMLDAMVRIAGDDPHRPGVMEQIAAVMEKHCKDPAVVAALRDSALERMDVYGSMSEPGLGIGGVRSALIGYREPHDHGECWAINVQVAGKLRLLHWGRAGTAADGTPQIRKIDEVTMGPGDVDCSPPGVAHEIYPLTDDSVELAVRCHSLMSVVQNRYDRRTGEHKRWSWKQKKALETGRFEVVGAEGLAEPEPPEAMTAHIK
jgi:hypothetical protein